MEPRDSPPRALLLLLVTGAVSVRGVDAVLGDCGLTTPSAEYLRDINFAVFLDIHQSAPASGQPPGGCGEINLSAVQELETLSYVIESLNSEGYIPGVKLGIIGPSTSTEALAVARILEAELPADRLVQISHSASASALSVGLEFGSTFGVIPPNSLESQVMVEALKQMGWNYVALMYTDDEYGREGADQIVRLSNSSGICLAFVEKIDVPFDVDGIQRSFDRILMYGENRRPRTDGVVYFGSADGAYQVVRSASGYQYKLQFLFSESVHFQPDIFDTYVAVSGGSLVVQPMSRRLPEFERHLEGLFRNTTAIEGKANTNPWIEELYRKKTNCDMPALASCGQPSSSDMQGLSKTTVFSYYMFQVALVFASLAKELYQEMCTSLPCKALNGVSREAIIRKLTTLHFSLSDEFSSILPAGLPESEMTFHINGTKTAHLVGPAHSLLEVTNFQKTDCQSGSDFCFQTVGRFDGTNLTMDLGNTKSYSREGLEIGRVVAGCRPGLVCEACLTMEEHQRWVYVPGDVIIVAMVPVHFPGENPFSCGTIRQSSGLQLAEAVLFAVHQVNQKAGIFVDIFPGNTIGVLIMNTCYSQTVAQKATFSVLFDDDPILKRKVKEISPRVIGFIGSLRSDVSTAVANILTNIKLVQVSYGSTSTALQNREDFPYFVRTCASDTQQGLSMILILQELGWKYFSVVYIDDTYGINGFQVLTDLAGKNDLCIAQSIKVSPQSNYYAVLDELRKKPSARAVVLFVRVSTASKLLNAFSEKNFVPGEFTFILTESVGSRVDAVDNAIAADGAISLQQKLPENRAFLDYLRSKMADRNMPGEVWADEFWENTLSCQRPGSYNRSSPTPCPTNLTLDQETHIKEPWVPFVVHAVYSLALGASSASRDLCGKRWCADARLRADVVHREVMKTRLDLFGTGIQVPVFDEDGNGVVEFAIYNAQRGTSGATEFVSVGYWNEAVGLKLNRDALRFGGSSQVPESSCPNEVECARCRRRENCTITDEPGASALDTKTTSDEVAFPVAVGILAFAVLCLLVAVVILWCRCRVKLGKLKGRDDVYFEGDQVDYLHATDPYWTISDRRPTPNRRNVEASYVEPCRLVRPVSVDTAKQIQDIELTSTDNCQRQDLPQQGSSPPQPRDIAQPMGSEQPCDFVQPSDKPVQSRDSSVVNSSTDPSTERTHAAGTAEDNGLGEVDGRHPADTDAPPACKFLL